MIEQDTVRLLRECDAGVKMGIASMDDVLEHVQSGSLKSRLTDSKGNHEALENEIASLLNRYHDEGKEPGAVAKGMSRMKTGIKLGLDESDQTIAQLMTDGCNMGIKSLNRYLNQYQAAHEASKGIARRLITLEEELSVGMRPFL